MSDFDLEDHLKNKERITRAIGRPPPLNGNDAKAILGIVFEAFELEKGAEWRFDVWEWLRQTLTKAGYTPELLERERR